MRIQIFGVISYGFLGFALFLHLALLARLFLGGVYPSNGYEMLEFNSVIFALISLYISAFICHFFARK